MLVALLVVAAMVWFRERPDKTTLEAKSKKPSEPIGKSPVPPPPFDARSKQMYSPLTTPPPNNLYMKNPKKDPVPSIYNRILDVDEKGPYDENFFKQRQIYTNWDDMEENEVLDNFKKRDFPMTGGVLVNGLNRKEIENPTAQYGMFVDNKPISKLKEKSWM